MSEITAIKYSLKHPLNPNERSKLEQRLLELEYEDLVQKTQEILYKIK